MMKVSASLKNKFLRRLLLLAAAIFCAGGAYSTEQLIFQPRFNWEDGSSTLQGTGCFVKGPNGSPVGLTSAHFIDFSGTPLLFAEWLEIRNEQPAGTSKKSWGVPGQSGTSDPMDLRSDYLLLEMSDVSCHSVLVLDDRTGPDVEEMIWFPNKNGEAPLGYTRIEGRVVASKAEYISIVLDQEIVIQSRSGTPVISKKNGHVIGILAMSEKRGEQRFLYLTPASSIKKALFNAKEHLWLRNIIGSSN